MKKIQFENAYYIKLGQNGKWESSSIKESKLRIGWIKQNLDDINQGQWDIIREQLSIFIRDQGAVTRDLNALRYICESSSQDVWITFFESKLWWCRVGKPIIYEDKISKYREVNGSWSDKDIHGNVLFINSIPGEISKIQGFRGTACGVKEKQTLYRLINDEPSPEFNAIQDSKEKLIENVVRGIKKLYWKDFETFVDLIFRQSGWRRLSMIGQKMKYADIELKDPITNDQYQVQVKSSANFSDFERYADQFNHQDYRKLYFVVHSPDNKLQNHETDYQDVELVLPKRLSQMAVDLGLVDWLMNKIK